MPTVGEEHHPGKIVSFTDTSSFASSDAVYLAGVSAGGQRISVMHSARGHLHGWVAFATAGEWDGYG